MDNNPPVTTDDKPKLLQAVELVLAEPRKIKEETEALRSRYKERYKNDKSNEELLEIIAEKVISKYSYYCAFVGGATSLTGVVPGLGTVIASFGGATADAALSMKYQIEMTMALAVVYGHDILTEEKKNLCLIVAGLGTVNQFAKEEAKQIGSKAFVKIVKQYLKGNVLQAIKALFKKIGITFTRKALEKAIPFGVGVIIGFSANKGLSCYVGSKAKDFFKIY